MLLQPLTGLTLVLHLHPRDAEVAAVCLLATTRVMHLHSYRLMDHKKSRKIKNMLCCLVCTFICQEVLHKNTESRQWRNPTTKQTKERKNRPRTSGIMTNTAGGDVKLFKTTKRFKDVDPHFIASWLACVRCFSAPEMLIQHHPRAWTYNLWMPRLGRDLTELPAEWETSWLHTTAQSNRRAEWEDEEKT